MTQRGDCDRLIAAVLTLALLAAPVTAAAQSTEPIKIGFSTEMSGAYSFFGTACAAGMKIAEQEINAGGGALGRPLDFIVVDNQTNPAQAAAAARSLDVQDHVLAISGPTSSDNALAIYGYAEQNKLPFVVPVAAFPQLTKPGTHYTFRVESDAIGWGAAIVKFIAERKPGAKLAILLSDFAYTRALETGAKYQAPKSNVTIVADVVFPQGTNDATVQAAQVVAAKPDFVLDMGVGAFEVTLTNELIDLGIKPDQIVHNVGTTNTILAFGPRSVGSFYGTFFDVNLDTVTPQGRAFIKKYTDTVGRVPSFIENFCYVTPYIIKAAIDKAGVVDREKFRDALSAIKMASPTDGTPIEFDQNGARKEYVYYMQLTGIKDKSYTAKKVFYTEWAPDSLPVYELMK
jgi:branched-chain amino acid transport system substrate-binding protein